MSDCLHCDINELVRKRLEGSADVDVPLLVGNVVESLVDLILNVTSEADQARIMADALAHFGHMYLEKTEAIEGGSTATH
jgi:hypothetical protein